MIYILLSQQNSRLLKIYSLMVFIIFYFVKKVNVFMW